MRITINGELKEHLRAVTVEELLSELGIPSGRVAVEVNFSIINKKDFHSFRIHDGDTIEIVNFVGGGTDCKKLGENRKAHSARRIAKKVLRSKQLAIKRLAKKTK